MLRRRALMGGTQINNYKYTVGSMVCNADAFGNYCTGSAKYGATLTFKCSDAINEQLLVAYKTSYTTAWRIYIQDNRIYYEETYGDSKATTIWNDWTIKSNTWYTLEFYGGLNSKTIYCSINGQTVAKTPSRARHNLNSSSAMVQVGTPDGKVNFRGIISVFGVSYGADSKQNTLLVNVEDATIGQPLDLTGGYRLYGNSDNASVETTFEIIHN